MKKALIILADGFEEIEAVTPIDTLRRAQIDIKIAGLSSKRVTGSHNITITANTLLSEYKGTPDVLILPGGMSGTTNLLESEETAVIIRNTYKAGGYCCAICAAARVLHQAGILDGKKYTCYPGHETHIDSGFFKPDLFVKDGNIITSRGPGTAMLFSLGIVGSLLGKETTDSLAEKLLFNGDIPGYLYR